MAAGSILTLLSLGLLIFSSSIASAEIVEHSFFVKNLTINRLCQEQVITAVNGSLPGPTIRVREGDTLVVHVYNQSPYNITIHWHGIFQLLSAWADGPEFITQCAIRSGHSFTYKFNITGQEGTLWWHAHVKWLRATVHGALIIRPRAGHSYPFPKPYREFPIILGEWWNANISDVENQAIATGAAPNNSNAFTINGRPGDLYPCSSISTYKIKLVPGKTYLLRIINAALNNQLFFKIADHKMTVVAVDASYTAPYVTDVVAIATAQTVDVLLTADQPLASYYMAASPYVSAVGVLFDNTTATGIITYDCGTTSSTPPVMPILPSFNDTQTAFNFHNSLTELVDGPFWQQVPQKVDEHMSMTVGLGLVPCGPKGNNSCGGPRGQRFAASMNNISFQLPTKMSILEAFFHKVDGVYETNFPSHALKFDYTNPKNSFNQTLVTTKKSTSVKKFKFNSVVQIVMQNTALVGVENHPIHLHGHNFYVLAQGFGNYDSVKDTKKFNLVNPQQRNTIPVPVGGWAVVRFRANNPGAWFIHCHLDIHLPWGLGTVFLVENGPTPSSTLPSPPSDLPHC